MTTANFMNVSSVKGGFTAHVDASKKLQDENLEVAETFAGLMNQASFAPNQVADDTSSSMDVKVNNTQSVADSYERYSYKDKQIENAKEPSVQEKTEEAMDALEQAEQDVMNAISEEYGVSEEEIQSMLDDMGLSVLDLLNPQNLVNFIMQLTGVATGEELLLDESFLAIMETMDTITDGLMKELNVDMNGLQELVNQMELVSEETEIPVTFQETVEAVVENQNVEETTQNVETTEDSSNVKQQDVDAESGTQTDDTKAVDTKTVDTEETTADSSTKNKESFASNAGTEETLANNQNSEGNALFNHSSNNETVVVNQTTVNAAPVADTVQAQFSSYLGTETVQIMEQIVEQMRVTLTPETTSMEMQLNPENLGKVYVNISSEEGVINAQFHATNEIVKEALENQIATLRENLNQAGVKVDAIEVTIASHEFERNLEQNHQSQEEQVENQENKTTKRRNISMDSLDELSGVMTEEETLVAQMMKENGNTVDFTA